MISLIYTRISSDSQNDLRQLSNLRRIAEEKKWEVKRVFQDTISGTIKTEKRPEFNKMLHYIESNDVDIVLVSEVSRIGRRVVDVLSSVEKLHEMGVGIYIQQFNIITFHQGKEDPIAKMLLQMLSIGSEMENNMRRDRQLEGIKLAKLNQKYQGRKKGAKADPADLLKKYQNVVDLLKKSDLSLRRITSITGHSINTVRKVAAIIGK